METAERRPVNPLLVGGAVSLVLAALLVLQHFMPLSIGGFWRSWLVLPMVLG
jgi:hypothetical protein